ncbi:glycosyltransferase family 4 protein [Corynebacterium uterequi]|uniref:Glycosyltransferase n=1 Tax=Corynebacterium uterequi TaxID=1072256 RepID=A0A0G3HLM0_9CORY|nr:glycosyltransferase family 4 protein [Corynebacterium uterequi]AKK12032.1 glycosyltransferase [Corynebacterium uterequi]
MKVLLLCWRDTTHPQGGGSERYLERVGHYLAGQGHEVIFRTAAYPGAASRERRDGILFSRAGGKYTVYLRALAAMAAGRLGFGPLAGVDVVVDTQNGIPFFARTLAGVPTILLTHHCHREQWPVAGRLVGAVGWLLESRVSPLVHRGAQYVTVSENSRAELIELGVRAEDIEVIANGVDPVPTPATAQTAQTAPAPSTHLVTLSRLVPHKQIEHAMDVLPTLDEEVVLDVIGSGWWEEELRAHAAARGLKHRVIFHGQVSEADKHALLSRATLHLMPSRKEGWGLAVIEAAQHGVPTIGYAAAGGLRDSIEDGGTGRLVADAAELAAVTRELLADAAQRRRLGENARRHAARYSWETTGRQFAELLERCARTRR